jgi:excisionase family DNA binding protein
MRQNRRNKRIKMSSKIEISKKCDWCGNVFIARKSSTSYCSHRCSNLAYKDKIRQQRLNALKDELSIKERTKQNVEFKDKEYLFPIEAARLLGISKATIYRYLEENMIISVRFKGKSYLTTLFHIKSEYLKKTHPSPNSTPPQRLKRSTV